MVTSQSEARMRAEGKRDGPLTGGVASEARMRAEGRRDVPPPGGVTSEARMRANQASQV
jgi:hypothetical protein